MKLNRNVYIFIFVAICSIIFMHTAEVNAFVEDKYDFENFTEDDAMSFVEEHNIKIPNEMLGWEELGDFTKNLIIQSYKNPTMPFGFNYSKTQKYAEDIRVAVCRYVSNDSISTYTTNTYVLRYNTVMNENGEWVTSGGYYNPDWAQYNCYAYAVNRCEMSNFYSLTRVYQPGIISSGEEAETIGIDVSELADVVVMDLEVMGYSNIFLSNTIPTVDDSQQLICIRKDYVDYHFMTYDQATDAWYHKPGNSAILKYNYTPSNDIVWWQEYSINGIEGYEYGQGYDSEIIFIRYSKNIIDTTPNSSRNIYIIPNKDVFYEVNIEQADHYRLKLIAGYEMDYELYDSNFDIVVSDSGNNNVDTCLSLTPGKYYLRINFTSSQSYSGLSASLYVDYDSDNNINSNAHTAICNGCGYSKVEAHTFECDSFENGVHYEKCVDCDYRNSQCTNAYFVSADADGHLMGCVDCEYTGNATHNFEYRNYNSIQHEKYCIDCGYVHSRERHVLQLTGGVGNYKQCQICGALVNVGGGGGGIFPVEPTKKNPEEETE